MFVVSNEGARLCSTEPDRRRVDAVGLLRRFGYRLSRAEQVLPNGLVRRTVGIDNYFQLFERAGRHG